MDPDTTLFALVYRPGPRWVSGAPLAHQPLGPHRAYIRGLARAGRILLAGPFLDGAAGGLVALRAPDTEAAAAVLAADPAVRDGVLMGEVRPWRVLSGDGTASAVNLAVVRRIFEVVESRGDAGGREARWAVYRAAYAPEVAIHEAPSLPYGGDYEGPEAVARHAQGYGGAWDGLQDAAERALEPEFLAGGDHVAVLWRQRAHDPRTGERFDMPAMSLVTLREGRVVESRMFHFDAGAAAAFLARAGAAGAGQAA
jgi:uncharacterized protein YciI